VTLDHAKAIAPLPCLARKTRTAIEGMKLSALARKSFSCLKSRVHWAVGTAAIPWITTTIPRTCTGRAASAEPRLAAIGPANLTSKPAMTRADITDTDHSVGARASTSRSARTRHDVTPNSPRAQTMVKTVMATAKTPKSCGLRMRATIAVTPMPDNRRKMVVPIFQIAPLRTCADSDRGFCWGVVPTSSIVTLGAAVLAEVWDPGSDGRPCAAIW
jgi:hypothetical protein